MFSCVLELVLGNIDEIEVLLHGTVTVSVVKTVERAVEVAFLLCRRVWVL